MRNIWLAADDAALTSQCRLDFFRSTGNGGQKRNKCATAVRLIHEPSGLAVTCDAERSQHRNRALALQKLRRAIALNCRMPWSEGTCVDVMHLKQPQETAKLLDLLASCQYRLSDGAAKLDLSTAKLGKLLAQDSVLFAALNRARQACGMTPLKADF